MKVCGVPCRLSLKHHSPEVFGSSRLLPQKPYVLLRACLALNSLYWLIRSVSVFGNAHWLLYLTHWTFALQTVYYFLALGSAVHLLANSRRRRRGGLWSSREIGGGGRELEGRGGGGGNGAGRGLRSVARDRSRGNKAGVGGDVEAVAVGGAGRVSPVGGLAAKQGGGDGAAEAGRGLAGGGGGGVGGAGDCGEQTVLERWRKLQWGLLIVCADSAVIVSGVYWAFLYNGWTDQLNLQASIHLFNTVFMVTNVFVEGSPFNWEHIGVAYIYGFLYLSFDIAYYLLASVFGSGDDSSRAIYFFLDWGGAPARAVTVSLFLMAVGLPLSHGIYVLVAGGRNRLRRMRPDWGWQGTDEEELERAMEVSGLRDADVWAPLTGDEGFDSEEEEMGGSAVFHHDFSAGVSSPKKQRR
ncbi:unnamed protein product [Pylaiella littoralis]